MDGNLLEMNLIVKQHAHYILVNLSKFGSHFLKHEIKLKIKNKIAATSTVVISKTNTAFPNKTWVNFLIKNLKSDS